jgi:uncharacterized repeat protein (TIGR03803 family)
LIEVGTGFSFLSRQFSREIESMSLRRAMRNSAAFLPVAVVLATLLGASSAVVTTGYGVLHVFCSESGCADGEYSAASLIQDTSGNLYGTTALGGAGGWGTIFELEKQKGGYKYKGLHSFCRKSNCVDGSDPVASPIIDTAGNLYGTTKFGGAQNGGTVFELMLSGGKKKFRVLHSFCVQGAPCADGSNPVYDGLSYQGKTGGQPYDGVSPLYGTTIYGGENNGGFSGVIYRMAPVEGKSKWKEQVLYQFCALSNCADGSQPYNGLTVDGSGNLFGVTFGGGGTGNGTVFRLSPQKRQWKETVLYNFCTQANCADGSNPEAPLVIDGSGGLVGTATSGGANGGGVVFSLAPDGTNYRVLYDFCGQVSCADGYNPIGALALDGSGNLFGSNLRGGDPDNDGGVIYELSGSSFEVLYTFCGTGSCIGGRRPVGGPVRDAAGHLFGTTTLGGAPDQGVVYEFTR